MAHPAYVKERAFHLFLLGYNPERISEAMGGSPSPNTIRTWASESDPDGRTWEDRIVEVAEAARRRVEQQASTERAKALSRTQVISGKLYDRIIEDFSDMKVKTLDQAIYAFKSLHEFGVKLQDAEEQRWNPVNAAQSVLSVMNRIPAVRKVLKENWGEFSKLLSQELNQQTHTHEVDAKVIEEKQ